MGKPGSAGCLAALMLVAAPSSAQGLSMKWGLENTWSYVETRRAEGEDLSVASKSKEQKYRAFAFNDRDREVREPMLKCFQRHEALWDQFRKSGAQEKRSTARAAAPQDADADRLAFEAYKTKNDPFCSEHAKKQAPRLYFDFVGSPAQQYVLERVEVTTLDFSEYRGGGFAMKEAWYDIVLAHRKGVKAYEVEPRLVFSGVGRVQLRLWSDNFYPQMGWMAPMGEYKIDIRFVFSAGGKTVSVRTGPFKIDV